MPSLERLINRDLDGGSRTTQYGDALLNIIDQPGTPMVDPWRIIGKVASSDLKGLRKALNWLCIFAASGVEIPLTTFTHVSNFSRDFDATFEDDVRLCEAILFSTWMKSVGRQDLQKLLVDIHWRNASTVMDGFGNISEELM